jgi:hypothetical protein
MEAFSESSNRKLREAQEQTIIGLDSLRSAAEFAATRAQEMKRATEEMQARIGKVGGAGDLLDACFGRFDAVVVEVEAVKRQLEMDHPEAKGHYDRTDVERMFGSFYTTEIERDVLQAALGGGPLPTAQQTFAGNSAELF